MSGILGFLPVFVTQGYESIPEMGNNAVYRKEDTMYRVFPKSMLLAAAGTLFSFYFFFPAAVVAVEPNEVIAYEHYNFVGANRSWKLEPDMRQRNVESLGADFNDIVSSVQVGSDVEAVFFEDVNFGGHNYGFYKGNLNDVGIGNDCFTSLIIVPKGQHILGASLNKYGPNTLLGGGLHADMQFFPIPQYKKDTKVDYAFVNEVMNDEATFVEIFGDVEVTLYEHAQYQGGSLTLPGADKSIKQFHLSQYGFDNRTSSVVVKVAGSPLPPPATPAAPGTPNIVGNWKGSNGLNYTITQNNTTFKWTASNGETGSGTINGTNINVSWKWLFTTGSAAGTIVLNAQGTPTAINWNNGVTFSR